MLMGESDIVSDQKHQSAIGILADFTVIYKRSTQECFRVLLQRSR